jgi:hypothetical protein
MRFGKLPFLFLAFVLLLLWSGAPAIAAQPTREDLLEAQTDAVGLKRGKKHGDEEWYDPMRIRQDAEPGTGPTAVPETGASRTDTRLDTPSTTSAANDGSVTSAAGSEPGFQPSSGRRGAGIVTGLGAPAGGSHGRSAAHGPSARSGIVTGSGGPSAQGLSHGAGRGVVNAAGAGAAGSATAARSIGAGIVTGAGTAIVPAAANGVRASVGIVTGAGGPPGHANAQGQGKGRH